MTDGGSFHAFDCQDPPQVEPLYAVIFTEMLNVFAKPEDEMLAGARFYALLFLALGAGSFIANIMQTGFFGTGTVVLYWIGHLIL